MVKGDLIEAGEFGKIEELTREAVELVKKAAEVVPQVGYVGWDVGISENGPVIIEGNSFPGVFQKRASLSKDKTGIIPKYRQYMDI